MTGKSEAYMQFPAFQHVCHHVLFVITNFKGDQVELSEGDRYKVSWPKEFAEILEIQDFQHSSPNKVNKLGPS